MHEKKKIHGLQLIINTEPPPACPILELAKQALEGGVDSIQFRHKGSYTRKLLQIVLMISQMCQKAFIPLIINDRIDIVMTVDASGVHLGQTDIAIKTARSFLGPDKIIGGTASNIQQAKQIQAEGADYIGFGHIFTTTTKIKSTPPIGVSALKEAAMQLEIPIIAIGGINASNLDLVREANNAGVAIVSAINASLEPQKQVRLLKRIWNDK
jgi:thiamine-phosphate pyrophosphorylase